jgi:hypothetical protein
LARDHDRRKLRAPLRVPTRTESEHPTGPVALRLQTRIFIGSAVLALAVALIIAAFTSAGVINMTLARVFLVFAWLICVGGIVTLEWFWLRKERFARIIILSLSVVASVILFVGIERIINHLKPEDMYSGLLTSGNDPAKDTGSCESMKRGITASGTVPFIVFAGGLTVFVTEFPQHIIAIRGRTLLSIDRNSNGNILVYAEFLDVNRRVIGIIKDNKFILNQNNVFYKERPDEHSLIVYDQHNDKVIDVKYNNKTELTVVGSLYYYYGLKISKNDLILPPPGIPNGLLNSNCMGVGRAGSTALMID